MKRRLPVHALENHKARPAIAQKFRSGPPYKTVRAGVVDEHLNGPKRHVEGGRVGQSGPFVCAVLMADGGNIPFQVEPPDP